MTENTYTTRLVNRNGEECADLVFNWKLINQNPIENTSTIEYNVQFVYDDDASGVYLYTELFEVYLLEQYDGLNMNGRYHLSRVYKDKDRYHDNVVAGKVTTRCSGTHTIRHKIDGSLDLWFKVRIDNIYRVEDDDGELYEEFDKIELTGKDELEQITREAQIVSATNFTDEENAVINYNAGGSDLSLLEAALTFDLENLDLPYREISKTAKSYTFVLTEEQRETFRVKVQGSDSLPIYYLLRATYTDGVTTIVGVTETERTFTVVGCNPQLTITEVKDIHPDTLALTGNENTFIKYHSMAEYRMEAVASKQATIVNKSVQCGDKVVYNMDAGVIQDVESASFLFTAEDSRNLVVATAVQKNFVDYVKPTCYQHIEIDLSGETGAEIKLNINGAYFNNTFGAVDNELKIELRHTQNDGSMGEWVTLTDGLIPVFNKNTYKLDLTISGLSYSQSYVFQSRVTDKLNVVQSSQYTVRVLPVFDWGEDDFNFNVPVNINADSISMNGETIIRHNAEAKNTVISADGGHIYLRPQGTNNTSGETIINPDGSVSFGGKINFADGFTIDDKELVDYVIETGTASMGSNGTWYWQKWASGKAEAWGCRNYGNMAVATAWGNLYRSDIFSQDLPEDVFITTPDVININIVNGNKGGWICKHEQDAPSAITTGSFIWVRPASATITPSYIGFHIIGLWKQ